MYNIYELMKRFEFVHEDRNNNNIEIRKSEFERARDYIADCRRSGILYQGRPAGPLSRAI